MNLYILVEGEETELQLYPKWLSHIIPELSQVHRFNIVTNNSYYILSGRGIPSIYNHAVNAILDINAVDKYDYFIIALDSEELNPLERKNKVLEHIEKSGVALNTNCKLEIIIHNKCIETWFLGNQKVYKRNPEGEKFRTYSKYYNVEINDPELMLKLPEFSRTAHFHEAYLKAMLDEHGIRYRKARPKEVLKKHYLDELIRRINDTPNHLKSFSEFMKVLEVIKSKI